MGASTNYIYDGSNVVQELSGSTPTANLLTGGIDEVFTRTDSSGTADFLTDALGSTLALTDTTGNALAQYSYGPFGNTMVTSGSSSDEFQYTGRENDGTGVYFYRGRYYSPTLQRFLSEDPAGIAGGINLYAYAANNPIQFIDPFGYDKKEPMTSQQPQQPQQQPQTRSLLSCTIQTANKLTISNGLAHIPGFGNYLREGSWGRTAVDVAGGGNAVTGILSAGQTFFGHSASGTELAQAGVGVLADPSMGLNPALKAAGAAGLPSAMGSIQKAAVDAEVGALARVAPALSDAVAEGASVIGLAKLAYDALSTAGSAFYCAATQ